MSGSTSNSGVALHYRPDIDGLRAVAVLSVVGYHAFPEFVWGGYAGVDVFFVISGFLISSIIFRNLERSSFSFLDFYARRIRRIFPTLLIVLAACYLFGWIVLFPMEYAELGKHVAAGAAFVSNLVLWSEAGYFDRAAELKPLLHLWSLGIEEQFYLAWPLVAWLAWKRRVSFLPLSVGVCVVSFALCVVATRYDVVAAFYSPPTRLWELMFGSIAALITVQGGKYDWLSPRHSPRLSNSLSVLGLLLVVGSFFVLTKETRFPGFWALIPVLGTAFVILAGAQAWPNRMVLARSPVVWIGLISFPLYLWHWPLLSFARILEGGIPSESVRVAAIIMAFVLAWLTYQVVERPIRFGSRGARKAIASAAVMAVVCGIGFATYASNGIDGRLASKPIVQLGSAKCEAPDVLEDICYLGNRRASEKIIVYGDSHIAHFMVQIVAQLGGQYSILSITAPGCFMGETFPRPVYGDVDECRRRIDALKRLKGSKVKAVITGQRWHAYHLTEPADIRAALLDRTRVFGIDAEKIIVVGSNADVPFECEMADRRPLGRSRMCPPSSNIHAVMKGFIATAGAMVNPPKVRFVYPHEILCPNDNCAFFSGQQTNYIDIYHLSSAGSDKIVQRFKAIIQE